MEKLQAALHLIAKCALEIPKGAAPWYLYEAAVSLSRVSRLTRAAFNAKAVGTLKSLTNCMGDVDDCYSNADKLHKLTTLRSRQASVRVVIA